MSKVRNAIFVPSRGKDEKKYQKIPQFETACKATHFKLIIPSFRMAGKVKEFVMKHHLAIHTFGSNFNGYGYAVQNNWYLLSAKNAKEVQQMLSLTASKPIKAKSIEDSLAAWWRRLVKLTQVSPEIAEWIAEDKLEAKEQQINELEERQITLGYSVQRDKLIRKIRRSNPLRYITNEGHAMAILKAYVRHSESNYESMLEQARDKAGWGEIDYSEVQSYARKNATYWGNVSDLFRVDNEDDLPIDEET